MGGINREGIKKDYQPIILIGAARSGTKILRDTISTHSEIEKIGYDINFVWKKYNEDIKHDELTNKDVKPKFKKFIYKYFKKKSKNKPFLIEKTVGNTLRIPFLLEIFPNAKFIILYRDGRDSVESVMRQWNTPPSNKYLIKKLFSVPVLQVLPFIIEYLLNVIMLKLRLKPSEKYVWGVRYKGFDEDLINDDLLTFCTKQWKQCVKGILENESKIEPENKIIIRYENLVINPKNEFQRIATFLKLQEKEFDYSSIKPNNVGKSKSGLSEDDYDRVDKMLKDVLIKLDYV